MKLTALKISLLAFAIFGCMSKHSTAENTPSTCNENVLQENASALIAKDQQLREQIAASNQNIRNSELEKLLENDLQNQKALDALVAECGWPESKKFFNSPLEAAFLIIQHAPYDYQKKYVERLRAAFEQGKIPKNVFELFEIRFKNNQAQAVSK